jgi:hypothetical protein
MTTTALPNPFLPGPATRPQNDTWHDIDMALANAHLDGFPPQPRFVPDMDALYDATLPPEPPTPLADEGVLRAILKLFMGVEA